MPKQHSKPPKGRRERPVDRLTPTGKACMAVRGKGGAGEGGAGGAGGSGVQQGAAKAEAVAAARQ